MQMGLVLAFSMLTNKALAGLPLPWAKPHE
jgi:hypothetical protein